MVIGINRHSGDEPPVVICRAMYGDGGFCVLPAEIGMELCQGREER